MIQRSAEQTLSRASAGNPKGPIPKDTRVTAVAAKKKIEAMAMRRRSSWAASLAQMAQARRTADERVNGERETGNKEFRVSSMSFTVTRYPLPVTRYPSQFDDLVRLDEVARIVGGEDDEAILAFGRDGPLDDRPAVGVEPDHGLV